MLQWRFMVYYIMLPFSNHTSSYQINAIAQLFGLSYLPKTKILLPWPGSGILPQRTVQLQRAFWQLHHTPSNALLFCQNKPTASAGNQSHLEYDIYKVFDMKTETIESSRWFKKFNDEPRRALSRIRTAMVIRVQHLEQMSAALKGQFALYLGGVPDLYNQTWFV